MCNGVRCRSNSLAEIGARNVGLFIDQDSVAITEIQPHGARAAALERDVDRCARLGLRRLLRGLVALAARVLAFAEARRLEAVEGVGEPAQDLAPTLRDLGDLSPYVPNLRYPSGRTLGLRGDTLNDARRGEFKRLVDEAQAMSAAACMFRSLGDPARLAPKIPFAEARGMLPQPVGGETILNFGAADGYGGTTRGVSILTRPKAAVISPADGWVAFSGPFRSFGRLLIINAGGGYYLLLAGMDHINVEVGQFVLAGEPVATMGDSSSGSRKSSSVVASPYFQWKRSDWLCSSPDNDRRLSPRP